MTKYQETLRLSGLVLNQQNIADSYNVSKKTVNRVLKWAKELNISCHLMKAIPMLYLQKKSFLLQNKSHPTKMVIPGFSEPPFRRIRFFRNYPFLCFPTYLSFASNKRFLQRPYIVRFIIFNRLFVPSTKPLL